VRRTDGWALWEKKEYLWQEVQQHFTRPMRPFRLLRVSAEAVMICFSLLSRLNPCCWLSGLEPYEVDAYTTYIRHNARGRSYLSQRVHATFRLELINGQSLSLKKSDALSRPVSYFRAITKVGTGWQSYSPLHGWLLTLECISYMGRLKGYLKSSDQMPQWLLCFTWRLASKLPKVGSVAETFKWQCLTNVQSFIS